ELVRAARLLAEEVEQGHIRSSMISEKMFAEHLYTKGLPDVDLLIRTSGEMRLSNFLLFQCAYAEFVFPQELWPDFTVQVYDTALAEFASRNRRFGGRTA
ncbi:MAG: undecaprenyl diphosphate synthase family protein, partial [Clostridia bacterium]|nr:undecaprenyl diphosphate synthase family protein [Clostridia bacterium]